MSTLYFLKKNFFISPHLSPYYLPCSLESSPYNYGYESRILVTKNKGVSLGVGTSEGAVFSLSILHPTPRRVIVGEGVISGFSIFTKHYNLL